MDTSSVGKRGSGGSWWRAGVSLLAFAAAWWGGYLLLKKVLPFAQPQRTWSVAETPTVPNDFLFLMFPVHDDVPIFDSPGGKTIGTLERAVGNDYGEVTSRPWIQVPQAASDGGNAFVRLADLRYLSAAAAGASPPAGAGQAAKRINYVGNFAKAYMARSTGPSRVATFMRYTSVPEAVEREVAAAPSATGDIVAFTLGEGANRRVFWARASFEKATPLAIDRLSAASRDNARLLRGAAAGIGAAVGAGLVAVAVWMGLGGAVGRR